MVRPVESPANLVSLLDSASLYILASVVRRMRLITVQWCLEVAWAIVPGDRQVSIFRCFERLAWRLLLGRFVNVTTRAARSS